MEDDKFNQKEIYGVNEQLVERENYYKKHLYYPSNLIKNTEKFLKYLN